VIHFTIIFKLIVQDLQLISVCTCNLLKYILPCSADISSKIRQKKSIFGHDDPLSCVHIVFIEKAMLLYASWPSYVSSPNKCCLRLWGWKMASFLSHRADKSINESALQEGSCL